VVSVGPPLVNDPRHEASNKDNRPPASAESGKSSGKYSGSFQASIHCLSFSSIGIFCSRPNSEERRQFDALRSQRWAGCLKATGTTVRARTTNVRVGTAQATAQVRSLPIAGTDIRTLHFLIGRAGPVSHERKRTHSKRQYSCDDEPFRRRCVWFRHFHSRNPLHLFSFYDRRNSAELRKQNHAFFDN
jgi:hypothetical protein